MLPTFNVSNISLPWRMATTGFVEGARWCYVDFWTLSMSDMFMKLSLNNEGTALNVRWGVLRPFVTADRILQEFGLTSERDPRVAAYNDTTEQILAAYPGDQVIYSDPQVVQLPFAVEASFQDSLIWGDGDVLLRNEFFAGRRPVPVQLMPFLRVEMRSQVKAAAKKSRGGTSSPRAPVTGPRRLLRLLEEGPFRPGTIRTRGPRLLRGPTHLGATPSPTTLLGTG